MLLRTEPWDGNRSRHRHGKRSLARRRIRIQFFESESPRSNSMLEITRGMDATTSLVFTGIDVAFFGTTLKVRRPSLLLEEDERQSRLNNG